ncbi:MAG: mevalonate kinase [DPANN group archaeon]|nr:mevalonate kinase [DPANN group archaeon]
MVKVSAPGKLMLFGEHSVVYDRPCIVTAVNHRMSVKIDVRPDNAIIVRAPEMSVKRYVTGIEDLNCEHPKAVRFVLTAVRNFFREYGISQGLEISTKSEFSSKFGFGSSSAVTVSTLYALSKLFDIAMDKKMLFNLSYKTVLDIQGVGSGFDVAAAIYGGTLYFVTGGKVIENLDYNVPIVVGYTGIKADTVPLINMVKQQISDNPKKIEVMFDNITDIVNKAKGCIAQSDNAYLGKLMNLNQEILSSLGVSTPELNNLIENSLTSGAFGAKLSGAGGGDCMIALAEDKDKVMKSITDKGGIIIPVETNVRGVCLD